MEWSKQYAKNVLVIQNMTGDETRWLVYLMNRKNIFQTFVLAGQKVDYTIS
jgi:hypothetical protein